MTCIKCGHKLEIMKQPNKINEILGYQCINPDCELNTTKKDENNWTLAEHKDSQEWAVRHIRNSEDEIAYLKTIIAAQQNQIVDLATQFKDFKEGLAKALGVDINTL